MTDGSTADARVSDANAHQCEPLAARIQEVAAHVRELCAKRSEKAFGAPGTELAKLILENRNMGNCGMSAPVDHKTVGEFLDNETTGHVATSSTPNSGFVKEAYRECFARLFFTEAYVALIAKLAPDFFREDGLLIDECRIGLIARNAGEQDILEAFEALPLLETFAKYLPRATYERIKEREQILARQHHRRLNADNKHLLDMAGNLSAIIELFADTKKFNHQNREILLHFLQQMEQQHGRPAICAAVYFAKIDVTVDVDQELARRYPITDTSILE